MKKVSIALVALWLPLISGCIPSFTVDDLYGIWTFGQRTLQFNEDGTFFGGGIANIDELTSQPLEFGEFRFEGTRLTFIQDEESRLCAGGTRVYDVEVAGDDRIKLIQVDDPCATTTGGTTVFFARYEP